jgi:hypothetical protein
MAAEQKFCKTNPDLCFCAETIHSSEKHVCEPQVPCSHSHALGPGNQKSVPLPELCLSLTKDLDQLVMNGHEQMPGLGSWRCDHGRNEENDVQEHREIQALREKKEMLAWMNEHFTLGNTFTLGPTMNVLTLTSAAIAQFATMIGLKESQAPSGIHPSNRRD